MEKIEKCPACATEQPALTLYLEHPERYVSMESIPDNRVYAVTCVVCGHSIQTVIVDNTITAVKTLREEMDHLYGESYILPLYLYEQ